MLKRVTLFVHSTCARLHKQTNKIGSWKLESHPCPTGRPNSRARAANCCGMTWPRHHSTVVSADSAVDSLCEHLCTVYSKFSANARTGCSRISSEQPKNPPTVISGRSLSAELKFMVSFIPSPAKKRILIQNPKMYKGRFNRTEHVSTQHEHGVVVSTHCP